jgi:hypothetical protein
MDENIDRPGYEEEALEFLRDVVVNRSSRYNSADRITAARHLLEHARGTLADDEGEWPDLPVGPKLDPDVEVSF